MFCDSSVDVKSVHEQGFPETLQRERNTQPHTLDTRINFVSAFLQEAFAMTFPRPQCFPREISLQLKL